ncbi:hypothetical protein [Flavobacterium sp. N1736]|uniref:hypothetical protein n=1 Tax=Flavobacterium sp. N1736 TaxID=2986823 RepID=UPI002225B6B9|nr:hypothetical protein [Flavobacterium sp. N1736]
MAKLRSLNLFSAEILPFSSLILKIVFSKYDSKTFFFFAASGIVDVTEVWAKLVAPKINSKTMNSTFLKFNPEFILFIIKL